MRCFYGIWPPPEVRAALAAVPRPDVPAVRWTTPARWHVTLAFLGELDDPRREAGTAALEDAARRVASPLEAVLGPATTALGRGVLCVPVRGLEAAAAAVRAAAGGAGLSFDPAPYFGHLTLARARGRGRAVPSRLGGTPLDARWPVRELCLVASVRGPDGARYKTVARATVL